MSKKLRRSHQDAHPQLQARAWLLHRCRALKYQPGCLLLDSQGLYVFTHHRHVHRLLHHRNADTSTAGELVRVSSMQHVDLLHVGRAPTGNAVIAITRGTHMPMATFAHSWPWRSSFASQHPSMSLVWEPLAGSTKFLEWFTHVCR